MKTELLTLRYLLALRRANRRTLQELKEIQLRNFTRTLRHAEETVPYYRRWFQEHKLTAGDFRRIEDIKRFPVITKREITARPHDFISDTAQLSQCTSKTTAGTTGIPLVTYENAKQAAFINAMSYRALFENGYSLCHKVVEITHPRNLNQEKPFISYIGLFNKTRISIFEPVERIASLLCEIRPDILMGYPTILAFLAREVERRHAASRIGVKKIFSTSEYLSRPDREYIKNAFGCDIIDLYGSVECSRLSWECDRHEGYHMDIDQHAIEFLDEKGRDAVRKSARIVVTNLYDQAMPLIRYEIGDIGVDSARQCSCGRPYPLMEGIQGRKDDLLVLPDGRTVLSTALYDIKFCRGVREFRAIQESPSRLTFEIVKSGEDFDCAMLEDTIKNLKKDWLGPKMKVSVKFVKAITRERSGKFKTVVSKMGRA